MLNLTYFIQHRLKLKPLVTKILMILLLSISTIVSANTEVDCLARAIYFESGNEPVSGKIAVGNVILNRVKHKEFPNKVCTVIAQKGQFQWYRNVRLRHHRVYSPKKEPVIQMIAEKLYEAHLSNNRRDNTNGSLFFNSNGSNPTYRAFKTVKIGRHQFLGLRQS